MPDQSGSVATAANVAMMQMISGFWISRAICVFAQLGLADQMKDGPRSTVELSALSGTHEPSLRRLLRALATIGVLDEDTDGRFALTALSETLRTDVPGSLCSTAISELGGENYAAWGDLLHSIKTGEVAFDHVFGLSLWESLQRNPEDARIFNDSMTQAAPETNEAILANYDFSGIKKIVDVGGGHGALVTSLLLEYPEMEGIVFDTPSVIEGARSYIDAAALSDRCQAVGGDFFTSVPAGADAYILKWIIHDWNDERALAILKNCRKAISDNDGRAISNDSRLLLMEMVIPEGNEPHFGKFVDLNMMVITGGRERSEEEFRQLLEQSGLRLVRIIPTDCPISIVEAVVS
ncbi:MAG TPA: methyltransferase [Pyrinomonadaceae bacterium]|nr:methyltransferase [Pyrinomonadaceae bacterium]